MIDVDPVDFDDVVELPGADLSAQSAEELTVPVVPVQFDEFTCSVCYLVHHRSQLATPPGVSRVCRERV